MEKNEIPEVVCAWVTGLWRGHLWVLTRADAIPAFRQASKRRYSAKRATVSHQAQNQSRKWLKLRWSSTCGPNLSWRSTVQDAITIFTLGPCCSQISGSAWVRVTPEFSSHFSIDGWHLERETVTSQLIYHSAWGSKTFSDSEPIYVPLTLYQIIICWIFKMNALIKSLCYLIMLKYMPTCCIKNY